ncbi:hypothetical protein [Streptomyces olivaceus]|uniref:hypothetical protein n=1 Tax=Streptomyces olivaceus TaxID=47716 RepID=UPI003718C44E
MAERQRRSSRTVQAREAARERAARFVKQEEERVRIAGDAILLQDEIADFDAETERRVTKLREERDAQLAEKREKFDALVVEMLDTEIPAQQAAERLGVSVGQVRAAKRSFDQAVAAHAGQGTEPPTAEDPREAQAESAEGDAPAATSGAADAGQPTADAYTFPAPGAAAAVVPAQEGSPENYEETALPPGSGG